MKSKGMSLVELIVTSGLLGLTTLALTSIISYFLTFKGQFQSIIALTSVRTELISTILNDCSWESTLLSTAYNPTMSCLYDSTSTCPTVATPLTLLDPNGQIIYSATLASNGFTLDGKPCEDFDLQQGNDDCPLKYEISWIPKCLDSACKTYVAEVHGKVQFKSNSPPSVRLSTDKYGFKILRKKLLDSCRPPTMTISSGQAIEGVPVNFYVTLDHPSNTDITFQYSTRAQSAISPDDFAEANSVAATIYAGTKSATIPITTIDDLAVEPDETFQIEISNISGANITSATADGRISDN